MKINLFSISTIVFLFSCSTAWAGVVIGGLTVTELWVGPSDFARATVNVAGVPANFGSTCSDQDTFAISTTDDNFDALFSQLLTAYTTGESIQMATPGTEVCLGSGGNFTSVTRIVLGR